MNYTLKDLSDLSKRISKKIKTGHSIYLKGNLGTGKTTFSKYLIKEIFKKITKKVLKLQVRLLILHSIIQ